MKRIKRYPTFLIILIALLLFPFPADLIPPTGFDNNQPEHLNAIPTLNSFILQVQNDKPAVIVGVYAEDLFAFPVLQQPDGQPGFVSSTPDVVTQFSLAEAYGTIGLLAHNTAAGTSFYDLSQGLIILIIFGDGSYERYIVDDIEQYQALDPSNPFSSFRNLENDRILATHELFSKAYQNQDLTFQTCIKRYGNESWGRFFVSASPLIEFAALDEASAGDSLLLPW